MVVKSCFEGKLSVQANFDGNRLFPNLLYYKQSSIFAVSSSRLLPAGQDCVCQYFLPSVDTTVWWFNSGFRIYIYIYINGKLIKFSKHRQNQFFIGVFHKRIQKLYFRSNAFTFGGPKSRKIQFRPPLVTLLISA